MGDGRRALTASRSSHCPFGAYLGHTPLLLDFKSTRHPRSLRQAEAWQLIGYLLLDTADQYRIDTVGLYLTRSGKPVLRRHRDRVRPQPGGPPLRTLRRPPCPARHRSLTVTVRLTRHFPSYAGRGVGLSGVGTGGVCGSGRSAQRRGHPPRGVSLRRTSRRRTCAELCCRVTRFGRLSRCSGSPPIPRPATEAQRLSDCSVAARRLLKRPGQAVNG
jgi:hypothetical protein